MTYSSYCRAALVVCATLLIPSGADAYCRRTSPAWTDANPVRVVLHPDMQNFMRHPYRSPTTLQPVSDQSCSTSADCGTGGLCVTGFPTTPTNRCRGPAWTRTELVRSVQWVIARINNESAADIPYVYLDLNDTADWQVEDDCSDANRPWMNCFQFDTIVLIPSVCNTAAMISADWNGVQWVDNNNSGSRNKIIRMQVSTGWQGVPWMGQTYSHFLYESVANNFPNTLLHEMGHALGLGHVANDYGSGYPTCVPNTAPNAPTSVCPNQPGVWDTFRTCAVMHNDFGEVRGLNNHFYGLDDIEGLVALYGLESSPDTRLFEDCDISTPSFFEVATSDLPLITNLAAAPRHPLGAVGFLAIGGRFRDPLFTERFRVYEWSWSQLTSTLVASIDTPGFRSTGPVGVSVSSTHRALSAHPLRLTVDARRYRRQIRLVRRQISDNAQTTGYFTPSAGNNADTAVPGVSSAYHAPSDSWIHAIRAADGQVLLISWRPFSGWSNRINTGIFSYATPSIACSPNTCFITVVEMPYPVTVSTQTRLQWVEGTFTWPSGGSALFSYGSVETSLYNVTADPVASVVQNPSGGWYYYVAAGAPQFSGGSWGTAVLTYRRSEYSTGAGALQIMLPQVPHFPGVSVPPTAGATGVCAELFSSASY